MTVLDFNTAGPQLVIDNGAWGARVEAVRERLKSSAHDLVKDIFPSARLTSSEARIGDVAGTSGESLSIGLSGDRAGLWTDHATGEGGDLIDLWRLSHAGEFREAIVQIEEWLGIGHSRPRFTTRIAKVAEERARKTPSRVDTPLGAPVASWHYYSPDGVVLGIVRRYDLDAIDEATGKRKKTFRPFTASGEQKMPDPRPLYRLPQILNASEVVLVEGEKCADALERVGIEATTAMGGANTDPAKTDWSPLAGKRVVIWEDNDAPGAGLSERVRGTLEAIGCTVRTVAIPAGKPVKWDAADAVEQGEDVAAIISPPNPAPSALRFRILSIDELAKVQPPEWRIEGIFPTHGSSTIYGAYESYKTWIALDMLLCLAAGKDWQGRKVKPCSILYVAGEGQHGLAHRVLGWCAAKNDGSRPDAFRALPEAVAIPLAGETDDLLRAIDALPEPPGVVAFDTITRMTGGGALNNEQDMQGYVRGMDRVRLHTGGHVMNVGHSGKDREKGLLGSIVLPAAMETIILCERSAHALTLCNSNPKGKQKDGPNFDDIRLISREVEFHRDGDPSRTLIFVPDTTPVTEPEPTQRLGSRQKIILTAIEQAAREGQALGFTRLKMMTEIDSGSLGKSLRDLVAKGTLVELGFGDNKSWRFS